MYPQSQLLFERSKQLIPGGVNSPVRAFGSVGGTPVFIQKSMGSQLIDSDGKSYTDYINSWGPMILGHQFKPVVNAVENQLLKGVSYGCPTEAELTMSELINFMAPWAEKVRLTSSGTEACMSALRVARGFTGKNKFIKFAGNYHGHADPFLVKAGSGLLTLSIPDSAGVPPGATEDTLIANYNDLKSVQELFKRYSGEIAAIIVEPVAGNMGCIPPESGFLEGLKSLCKSEQSLLIFDEVMTGFRLARGGAAELYGVIPDMVTYGKVIGGGLPVGAFAGSTEIMNVLAPLGPVYQAGTLSGNPLAMASGIATLQYLKDNPNVYDQIDKSTQAIEGLLRNRFKNEQLAINRVGSMISIHFGIDSVTNIRDATAANNDRYNKLFHHMLKNNIYLPPSAFESWFISKEIKSKELNQLEVALSTFS